MLDLAGYADRLSVRPGETISFKVSSSGPDPFSARLVRVICADPNPAGPGMIEESIATAFEGDYPSRTQAVHRGSYGVVDAPKKLAKLTSFTIVATIWPTRIGDGEQTIVSWLDTEMATGVALALGADGRLIAAIGMGRGQVERVANTTPLVERTWYRAFVSYDGNARLLTVGTLSTSPQSPHVITKRLAHDLASASARRIFLAAFGSEPVSGHFNGKIEGPAIFDRALDASEFARFTSGKKTKGVIAHWDFARKTSSTRIIDIGPNDCDGHLVNMPTRAMTGASWDGTEMCWRHAPDHYGAIHFHADDLYDCGWDTDFAWKVPKKLKSGIYALRLTCGSHQENIPFFIVPPKMKRPAKICVLVSTFTYVVYHNHARPEWQRDPAWREAWLTQAKDWKAYPHAPAQYPEYGFSTYNNHTDGSGIAYASWLRPMLNVRCGYVTYPYPEIRGSGLRHFPADTHLTAWLEAKGHAYDIVTDLELDEEGLDLIKSYPVVMTGSHPEYHTPDMLTALAAYRDGGGRFMYLGGNGFYWKVARSRDLPAAIEIRRGEGGIRAWAAEAGEYYNAFDGGYGGLWRRNGRPPQHLVGVGFTAQGNFVGSYYRRRPESADPRAAWILEGVSEERIGDFGLSGHGAAGFELDRTDKRLGTPAHAIVIASSEGHRPEAPWVLVPEEQLTHIVTLPGIPAAELIRADLTFFEAPNNGAVFSTGSITWCGSLPHNNFDNNVSRITQNVLEHFLDPKAEFAIPR